MWIAVLRYCFLIELNHFAAIELVVQVKRSISIAVALKNNSFIESLIKATGVWNSTRIRSNKEEFEMLNEWMISVFRSVELQSNFF